MAAHHLWKRNDWVMWYNAKPSGGAATQFLSRQDCWRSGFVNFSAKLERAMPRFPPFGPLLGFIMLPCCLRNKYYIPRTYRLRALRSLLGGELSASEKRRIDAFAKERIDISTRAEIDISPLLLGQFICVSATSDIWPSPALCSP